MNLNRLLNDMWTAGHIYYLYNYIKLTLLTNACIHSIVYFGLPSYYFTLIFSASLFSTSSGNTVDFPLDAPSDTLPET